MERLETKVALVTGGASGIGRATAHRLAADGAHVVITDIQRELGEATAKAEGFTFLQHDVTDEAQWSQVVGDVEGRFGRLDVLVNSAGIWLANATDLESTLLDDWQKIFAVNVDGVFLGCKAVIPAMSRSGGGSIVNISSIAALRPTPHAAAYGAGKAAVAHLTQTVAAHCASKKLAIRCNSVHPGFVRTPLWDRGAADLARRHGWSVERIVADAKAGIPLGDFTQPEDVAAAVCFLASDDSRHITGDKMIVDGGVVTCGTYNRT